MFHKKMIENVAGFTMLFDFITTGGKLVPYLQRQEKAEDRSEEAEAESQAVGRHGQIQYSVPGSLPTPVRGRFWVNIQEKAQAGNAT